MVAEYNVTVRFVKYVKIYMDPGGVALGLSTVWLVSISGRSRCCVIAYKKARVHPQVIGSIRSQKPY